MCVRSKYSDLEIYTLRVIKLRRMHFFDPELFSSHDSNVYNALSLLRVRCFAPFSGG
jgi:hypothetical protein